MDSAIKTCYDARAYIVNTIAALEMILSAGLVTSDQERKLLEMAHRNANAALKTVDLLFESLCATPAPANT